MVVRFSIEEWIEEWIEEATEASKETNRALGLRRLSIYSGLYPHIIIAGPARAACRRASFGSRARAGVSRGESG